MRRQESIHVALVDPRAVFLYRGQYNDKIQLSVAVPSLNLKPFERRTTTSSMRMQWHFERCHRFSAFQRIYNDLHITQALAANSGPHLAKASTR